MARRERTIIVFCGGDGTGKSTQAKLLVDHLNETGAPAAVIWNRWEPRVVGLVMKTARRISGLAHSSQAGEEVGDQVASAVASRPVVAQVFSRVSWFEYLMQTRSRLLRQGRGAHVVVFDRYVVDMVVDRARRLGWSDAYIAAELERAYRRGFPRPAVSIFFDAPPAVLVERRPEERPQGLAERSALYARVAKLLGAPVVNTADSIESTAERIWEIVKSGAARETKVSH